MTLLPPSAISTQAGPVPGSARQLRLSASAAAFLLLVAPIRPVSTNAQAPSVDVAAQLAEARRSLAVANFPQAEQELRRILALRPDDPDAHYLLGYTLFREHRPTESLAEFTAGSRGRAPTAEELTTIASDYVLLKDLPDAERWLLVAVKQEPDDATAWYLLGRTQYNQDRNGAASESFLRCLELHPTDVRAEYNLGLAYERLQRPDDAIAAYRKAITWQSSATNPDAQPYLDLGALLLRQAKPAEALDPLSSAARFSPRNAFVQQELGLAFEALGRYDEAIAALKRAAALAPTAQQPHFFLGRIFRHLDRKAEAAAEYEIVSKLLGSHSDSATPNIDQQPSSPVAQ